jgi:hypothetical protein
MTMPHVTLTSPSQNVFTSKGIPVVPQPSYSPDPSPCDFFLFPKLKNFLKGYHFGTLENIQKSVTDMLKTCSTATESVNNLSFDV